MSHPALALLEGDLIRRELAAQFVSSIAGSLTMQPGSDVSSAEIVARALELADELVAQCDRQEPPATPEFPAAPGVDARGLEVARMLRAPEEIVWRKPIDPAPVNSWVWAIVWKAGKGRPWFTPLRVTPATAGEIPSAPPERWLWSRDQEPLPQEPLPDGVMVLAWTLEPKGPEWLPG